MSLQSDYPNLDYPIAASSTHSHNTHFAFKSTFQTPIAKSELFKKNLKFIGLYIWNSLPEEFKSLNAMSFKLQYKKHLINSDNNRWLNTLTAYKQFLFIYFCFSRFFFSSCWWQNTFWLVQGLILSPFALLSINKRNWIELARRTLLREKISHLSLNNILGKSKGRKNG